LCDKSFVEECNYLGLIFRHCQLEFANFDNLVCLLSSYILVKENVSSYIVAYLLEAGTVEAEKAVAK
jgi:hypothetical protein